MQPFPKKVWQKPEIIILDTDDSVNAKNHPNVKEGTGFPSNNHFVSASGNNSFIGTRLEAIS